MSRAARRGGFKRGGSRSGLVTCPSFFVLFRPFWDFPDFFRNSPICPLQRVNGHGRSGGQTAGGHPKAPPRPRQPPFAVPAMRELESACRVSILWDAVTVPTVCFSGVLQGVTKGGQQQFATQTLRVHLLGIDVRGFFCRDVPDLSFLQEEKLGP